MRNVIEEAAAPNFPCRPRVTSGGQISLVHDGTGEEVARRRLEIPCSGSRLWRYGETFAKAERARAGSGAYLAVRDATCRLFGYYGLLGRGCAFSLDHMFGFLRAGPLHQIGPPLPGLRSLFGRGLPVANGEP